MKHVILGAGPSGVIAAETIRKHAPADEIIIVGDEPEAPYSRMAIPYLLIGNIKEAGTHLRPVAGHFEALRIQVKRGRAKAVNTVARTVTLEDGTALAFDRLLIATGSSPNHPPIPGADGPGVHPCWTLADARAIMAAAKPGARVLQMGAGFIGCIILEALAARGVKLSVVEMGDRMVPRMMGATAGGMIKDWCQKKGVAVYTGAKVQSIERPVGASANVPGAPPMRVKLSTGQVVDADLVISAVGVRPNIGFLNGSGIKCATGVLADVRMESNVSGVFAAGDCAEAWDRNLHRTVVSAIQPNAADQARIAGLNMAGRGVQSNGVTQINVLDTLGLISTSFGNWEGVKGGEHVELTEPQAGRHLSLQFEGERLIGCNSVGWSEHVGAMRGLVEGQVRLGEWKAKLMKDPTQLMAAYLATGQQQSAMAHIKAA